MADAPGTPPGRKHPPSRAEFEANLHDLQGRARATSDRINARTGRNLLLAIVVGIVLGGLLVTSLVIIKELFMLFALALVVITAFELASALRSAGRDVPRTPLFLVSLGLIPLSFYGLPALGLDRDAGHWVGTLAGVVLVTVWRLVELIAPSRRASGADVGKDLLAGVLVVVYIVFLGTFTVLMTAQDGGQWWTLGFLIVVVSTDTGAYVAGLSFGRHKMAPIISPGKTWEGFAGSIVFAVVAGVLVAWLMLGEPLWVGVVLGLAMVASATGGDLAESLIKRDLGVKDISTWLPGHGGVLDRLDSTLLSAPVAYALFLIFT